MIFSNFNQEDIVVGRINQVSSGMFGTGSLFLSQSQLVVQTGKYGQAYQMTGSNPYDVKNGQYYENVYAGGDLYFSIAYGDFSNSGSSYYDVPTNPSAVLNNETKVIYTQYRNTLLQPGDNLFNFASGSVSNEVSSEAIFALNFASDKVKDQIDPGQIQLNFSGAFGQYSYIDDSQVINKQSSVYNLVSGSIKNGVPVPYLKNGAVQYCGIGLVYPSNGVVILNAILLDKFIGIVNYLGDKTVIYNRSSYSNSNPPFKQTYYKLWTRDLYSAMQKCTKPMAVRRSEFVPSTNYFIRVKNKEFNYSNNPTFVSDGTDGKTKGTIIYQDLINNPQTYITTVGLYDSNNELLAVGKLSRPTKKSFDNELLIKCRIDF